MFSFIKRIFGFGKKETCLGSCGASQPASYTPVLVNAYGYPTLAHGQVFNAIGDELTLVRDAVELANKILATEVFKNKLISSILTETNGLTNAQVYEKISETIKVANVSFFTGNWRQNHIYHTMGIDLGDGVVYCNRVFVKDPLTLASLICHEALGHQNGFSHFGDKSTSVPYQINNAFEYTAKYLGIK